MLAQIKVDLRRVVKGRRDFWLPLAGLLLEDRVSLLLPSILVPAGVRVLHRLAADYMVAG